MEKQKYDQVVETARSYYNSTDADTFYFTIWGGEDIHIGKYYTDEDSIFEASRRTVQEMADLCQNLKPQAKVLDLGAGYGGAARYLAKTYGCQVVALNLSETENERNRQMNREQGLDHLIEVIDASFEDVPYPDNAFDLVWSQDSFLHSGDREKVVEETGRLLRQGGEFVFTDPMKREDCSNEMLKPILDRLQLSTLGSVEFYRETAEKYGLQEKTFIDHSDQLPNHYGRVLAELEGNEDRLKGKVSEEYINNMKKGLRHWVEGGRQGRLTWGIFLFVKS